MHAHVLVAARNRRVPWVERRLWNPRNRDEHATVGTADARELSQHLVGVLDVLERLEAEHVVEFAVCERQTLSGVAADGQQPRGEADGPARRQAREGQPREEDRAEQGAGEGERRRVARDVAVRVAPDLPAVEVNAAAVELCLTNYLSNAIKYSDPAKVERWVEVRSRLQRSPGASSAHSPATTATLRERFARCILEHQVELIVLLADLVEDGKVRMRQGGGSLGVDQELAKNLALTVNWVRMNRYATRVTVNRAQPTSGYASVQAIDPGPDGVAGSGDDRPWTVYERTVAAGTDNYLTNANTGEHYNTVDLSVHKRFAIIRFYRA